jgi:Flp pilus assembly protein TadD
LALVELGGALIRKGEHGEGLAKLLAARQLVPESEFAATALAVGYFTIGDLKSAESSFRQALDLNASYYPAAQGLARVLAKTGRPEEAKAVLQGYVPQVSDPMVLLDLATIEFQQGQLDEAQDSVRRVLAQDPNHHSAKRLLEDIEAFRAN